MIPGGLILAAESPEPAPARSGQCRGPSLTGVARHRAPCWEVRRLGAPPRSLGSKPRAETGLAAVNLHICPSY